MNTLKEKINKYIFKRKQKYQNTRHKRIKKFMNYDDIHRVLLIYDGNTKNKDSIQKIISELIADGKSVYSCSFVGKKQLSESDSDMSGIITFSDLSFWGRPRSTSVDQLLAEKYDLVLDLTCTDILPLRYILLYAQSPFKVGQETEEPDLFDFMIRLKGVSIEEKGKKQAIDKNEYYLFNQVIFYLKNIKSNN